MTVLYVIFCLIFGGLFLNSDVSNNPLSGLRYISIVFYPFQATMNNEFLGLVLSFHPKGYPATTIPGSVILSNYALSNPDGSSPIVSYLRSAAEFVCSGCRAAISASSSPSRRPSRYSAIWASSELPAPSEPRREIGRCNLRSEWQRDG